jgi:DNA invertase Pin-like site-specific DNA recombinase
MALAGIKPPGGEKEKIFNRTERLASFGETSHDRPPFPNPRPKGQSMTSKTTDSATRAVAYYRSSLTEFEGAIESQRQQVREWAEKHGLEIIREFVDAGVPGAEERPGFAELLECVKTDYSFQYVVCLDASRWARLNYDEVIAECRNREKDVVHVAIAQPEKHDPVFLLYERFRDRQRGFELGARVRRGRMFAAQKGYWTGGTPPYGLRRLLLDEKGNPLHLLEPGQRKLIQKQHVALVAGEASEVAAIRRIFHEFVDLGRSPARIASGLNGKRIPSPGGGRWTARHVLGCLRNKVYANPIVYRRKATGRGPTPDRWVRTPKARPGIVSPEQFQRAQEMLAEATTDRLL